MPWTSSGEVQFNRIKSTRECITQTGLANSSTQMNPSGSVLLGMIGEGRTRGQVAILDIPACNNQNCAAIWVSETEILPEYIYYYLWSQYEATRRGSSGNNQPALNKARVEQLMFQLPPREEQRQIVSAVEQCLSMIEQIGGQVDADLKRAARLRQSILKRAFAGELVPQDPTDEPASVLLERICEERAREAETGSQSKEKLKGRAAAHPGQLRFQVQR
ncbi:MAG: restriction endonuclease subunit S [Chloroflexia bacterium]